MIKTTYRATTADVDELFRASGRTLAPMDYAEADAYDGRLTLADEEEYGGEGQTVLWLSEDGFAVTATGEGGEVLGEEECGDLESALEAYERLTLEHVTNATRIIM